MLFLFRRLPPPPHPAGSLRETKTALPPRPFVLPGDLADGAARLVHLLAGVEQQGAGAAGEVHHTLQPLLRPGLRCLAVQRDDAGEDVGNLLWGVKSPHFVRPSGSLRLAISAALRFTRLLARPSGKLADQVFISIAHIFLFNLSPK